MEHFFSDIPSVVTVDSDLGRAQRLMDALRSFRRETKVEVMDSLDSAHRELFNGEYTAVVLAPIFPEEELKAFIDSGRKTFGGQDCAFVLLVEEGDQNEDTLALGMLAGVNGFLFSPFSAEGVSNVFQLAAKLKAQRIESAQKAEIADALRAAKGQLDLISAALHASTDLAIDNNEMESLKRALRACLEKNPELFYRMMIGSFIWETKEAPPTKSLAYRGGSARVRKIIAERAKRALSSSKG